MTVEESSATVTKFPLKLPYLEGLVTFYDRSSWEFRTGEYTIKHCHDGSIRVGTFDIQGRQEGTGYYRLSNGSVYDGQFKNHLPHGVGLFRYTAGEIRYCRGMWIKGMLEGEVNIIYFNKNIYMGQYHNGKRNGRGEMKFHKTKISYSGDWVDGVGVGSGTLTYSDCQYVGQISNCLPHGYGSFINKAGDIIYGRWMNGIKQEPEVPLSDEELCHEFASPVVKKDDKKLKPKPVIKSTTTEDVVVEAQQQQDDETDDNILSYHPAIRRKDVTLGAFISPLIILPMKEKKQRVFLKKDTNKLVSFLNQSFSQEAIDAAIHKILISTN
jgi:hypothetical protein